MAGGGGKTEGPVRRGGPREKRSPWRPSSSLKRSGEELWRQEGEGNVLMAFGSPSPKKSTASPPKGARGELNAGPPARRASSPLTRRSVGAAWPARAIRRLAERAMTQPKAADEAVSLSC